ncbi:type III-B CRISPR module RAMP protein Cmr4 [bacterium]|nr:type III-B CRISPR module RAMP protein Cmr4 [candidate division CSSED10-310 bacterium]
MFKEAKMLALIVETPLHVGSGNDLGIVDLPIQREKHTNFPKIEASGLKGCLREAFEHLNPPESCRNLAELYQERWIAPLFGPEKEGELYAGALGFTDARLLLFPVKSLKGVFAWITCPMVLERLKRDLEMANIPFPAFDPAALEQTVPGVSLCVKDTVVLEEYAFKVDRNDACKQLAEWCSVNLIPEQPAYQFWQTKLKTDLVVLRNKDFQDFVTMSTEVIARTRIENSTGTVADGALWYEEYLPTDTLLYSLVLATSLLNSDSELQNVFPSEQKIMEFFIKGLPPVIQVGGNATIGKGLVRTKIL